MQVDGNQQDHSRGCWSKQVRVKGNGAGVVVSTSKLVRMKGGDDDVVASLSRDASLNWASNAETEPGIRYTTNNVC